MVAITPADLQDRLAAGGCWELRYCGNWRRTSNKWSAGRSVPDFHRLRPGRDSTGTENTS